ncbi:hypothetical protein SLEP1_g42474 [Rubroshorea leprosula]|uniref:Integrase catalytic domain-containing protein n=1 Tax=Rubroshorea leprosula TaxID=152421 RepID=A0AAV5L9X6_9ROSI|nr:hypothetical protein SLEP1_g42474 [Rubroshorea leprosula]
MGAILVQHDDSGKKERVIYYVSKKFNDCKRQAITDHLAEHVVEDYEPIDWDFPNEDILAIEAKSDSNNWKLFFDGAINQLGCGLGAVLVSPKGDHFPIAIKLDFACTNNIVEYEACIAGIHVALDMNVQDLEIYEIQIHLFTKNQFMDALATLASMIQISNDDVIKPLKIKISQEPAHCMEIKVDDKPWFHDIKQFLQMGNTLYMLLRYGQPEAIITDNASNLNNDMMTTLGKQFKIKHLNSSPHRPKMNSAMEAANKNIKKILAKMTVTYKDWHEMLPYALHAYRTSIRTSTGATPYSLVYGMEVVPPIELEIPSMRILSESILRKKI